LQFPDVNHSQHRKATKVSGLHCSAQQDIKWRVYINRRPTYAATFTHDTLQRLPPAVAQQLRTITAHRPSSNIANMLAFTRRLTHSQHVNRSNYVTDSWIDRCCS